MSGNSTADELIAATVEARELIREAHEAVRDLSRAVQEARRIIREEVDGAVQGKIQEAVASELETLSTEVRTAMDVAVRKVHMELERIAVHENGARGLRRG